MNEVLTPFEREALELYRQLDAADRATVERIMELMIAVPSSGKEA